MTSGRPPSLGERVYVTLLRLFPSSFRAAHGADSIHAFRALERDTEGVFRTVTFWLREWMVLLANATRVRLRRSTTPYSNPITPSGLTIMMTAWRQDIGYAFRTLKRSPGFALVVMLTLGLGIGINASVFSVVNGVLLKPLPYGEPERLQFIWDGLDWIGIPRAWVNPREVYDLRERLETFQDIAAIDPATAELIGDGAPEVVSVAYATDNIFDLLGTTPFAGRLLTSGDDEVGRGPVAVLGYEFWNLRFGGDPGIVGRTVQIDGTPVSVVGVLQRGFPFRVHASLGDPVPVDMWLPLQVDLSAAPRGSHFLATLGRIRSDVSVAQAHAELERVSRDYDSEFYNDAGFRFRAVPIHEDLVNAVRPALVVLLGAVGLVLLIASTNIATLLLARAQKRDREFAIRRALGAAGSRIVRQLVTEGLVMSSLGAVLGFGIAWLTTDFLVGLAPEGIPRAESIHVDPVVLAFTGGLAVLVGVICGMTPAVQVSGGKFSSALADIGRSNTTGKRANRLRSVLVVIEFALSVVLLVGTGLLVQSFSRIQNVDPGFTVDNVLTMGVPLPNTRYADFEDRVQFSRQLTEGVNALPGVVAGGMTSSLPLTGNPDQTTAFKTESGEVDPETTERVVVDLITATPGYFQAVGVSQLAGRGIEWSDRADSRNVAVVDHLLAERFWPDAEPLGRMFRINGLDVEVVGVVRQARQYQVHEDDRPQVYLPHAQYPNRGLRLAVRGEVSPTSLARSVRGLVAALDPNQAVSDVATLEQIVGTSLSQRRFTMLLMAGFGLSAMLLAAIGLYGVTGYSVSQRFQEIGLRMALGADRSAVFRLVFKQTGRWVGLGLLLGTAGALGLSGLMSRLLFDVGARDFTTIGTVALVLAGVAFLATYLPATRAARIDPTIAMRAD